MRNCKKILIIFMIITIIMPICLTLKVEATNGDALITNDKFNDKDGYSTSINEFSSNKFIDNYNNYFNLYCVDGGRNRPFNTEERKVTDEKYIIDYITINNDLKNEIFKDDNQYNSMLWFADNMYLWKYDETILSKTEILSLKKKNIEEIKK